MLGYHQEGSLEGKVHVCLCITLNLNLNLPCMFVLPAAYDTDKFYCQFGVHKAVPHVNKTRYILSITSPSSHLVTSYWAL